jgi:hypothetical protein
MAAPAEAAPAASAHCAAKAPQPVEIACCPGGAVVQKPQAASSGTPPPLELVEIGGARLAPRPLARREAAPTAHAGRLHDLGRYTLFDSLLI